MNSKISTIHWPSSNEASSRGAGTAAGSAADTDNSARYMGAWSGQALASMALTKIMLPSSSVSREARPGENPPSQLAAVRTRPPASCSTMALTAVGTCAQSRRLLLADALRSAPLLAEMLMGHPKGFGGASYRRGDPVAEEFAQFLPRAGRAACRRAYRLPAAA